MMIMSVKKAMDILTILSCAHEVPITLGELSEKAGINKSTCAHIVDTLCESFYVERVSRKEGYRLGPWSYMLSRYGHYQNSLVTISAPVLKWLYQKTNASVFISVICNGKKFIVYHIDKRNILPMSDGNIIQGYLETTASGLLLMANMDNETLHYTLSRRKKAQEKGITEISSELKEQFKEIRATGYCAHSEDPQTRSHAFAVTDGSKTVAAVGILYPTEMDTNEYREEIIKFGHIAASEISRRMFFK